MKSTSDTIREEAREKLKSKALKLAYEIAVEIEKVTKTKLLSERFDFIFERTRDAVIEGFVSGVLFAFWPILWEKTLC